MRMLFSFPLSPPLPWRPLSRLLAVTAVGLALASSPAGAADKADTAHDGEPLGLALSRTLGFSPAGATERDPLSVNKLAAGPMGSFNEGICSFPDATAPAAPLTLAQVVDRALCNNPQTRAAWSSARAQAAQVGVARGAYLPSLTGNLSASRNRNENSSGFTTNSNQASAGLSASYVLFDFGARDAALQAALESLTASNYTLDATLQRVFLTAVQSYFNLFAARAAIDASTTSERSADEALKAATARNNAGTATPADRLQAQTAYSQAVLNRIQAEGNARSAEGVLANTMGLDASKPVPLVLPDTQVPDQRFDSDLDAMISAAKKQRPDLAAAEAQVRSAQANVDLARASGRPTVSLTANINASDTSLPTSNLTNGQAFGITLSIPLFQGFAPTYRTEAARAQADNQLAQRDTLALQVALDVWQAHAALVTNTQAVRTSADLVASATESERLASGRYRAGVGSILDVLTAQSALASARQQNIQAVYNFHIAKAALARSMGQLDAAALDRYRIAPSTGIAP